MIFDDRQDAGSRLANHLLNYQNHPNTVVLGLSCGGMPVAFEIAQSLGLGIHTLIVRKIRSPQYINLSLGVIAEQNIELLLGS